MKEKKTKKTKDPDAFFSDRKNVIRLVLFLLSLVVAVGAITYGVYRIGYKEEGSYVIEANADGDLPFYASGIKFVCHMTGSSKEIKARLNQTKADYSLALKTTYQLFDPNNTYPGVNNLAAINEQIGQDVKLTRELFDVLSDAWEKTRAGEGYSVFAGPLNAYYHDLRYAFEPMDPLQDSDAMELTQRLGEALFREGACTLTFVEKDLTVRLELSEEVENLLREYGLEGVLDLGVLYDAYRLQFVANALEDKGETNGYLSTDSGLTVALSGQEDLWYCFYSEQEGEAAISAQVPGKAGTAACLFRIFPLGEEEGFYSLSADGKTVYRHPYGWAPDGESPVTAVLVQTDSHAIVEGAYLCYRLLASENEDVALALMQNSGNRVLLALDGQPNIIHTNRKNGVIPAEGYLLK